MYKVLLVDDERIILEGISILINWEEISTELIGTARNGVEAYDLIVQDPPDIIISDIRMPGLDGIELVKKVKKQYPTIHFILLSGYAEFDYARQAMQYGVKHYLLKPCNEQQIIESLKEVVADLHMAEKRESVIESTKNGLHRVLPYAQEQFLKEFISNKIYGERDWEHYQKVLNIPLEQIHLRMILFQLEGEIDLEHLFALKNIAEEILGASLIKLSSNIGDKVIILVEECDMNLLFEHIDEIKHTFYQFYKVDFTVAISNPGSIKHARRMYADTLECLKNGFLTKKKHSSIITKILESIEQNLENPELSLNWISNQCLYMNPDYLGKLFKKEVGEKFSNYVVKIRIEKAMKLIKQKEDVRVFEVAESTGFGNNPQYFSQVFKKYTGFSPSDYKNAN